MMRTWLPVLVVIALATGSTLVAADVSAPDFALPDADGAVHRLADYKGRVVLVDFWASWCAPCKASFPQLDALHRELARRGVSVVAVNLDEQRRAADAFLSTRPHTMPVLFDPRGTSATAFSVRGMPSSVILDRHGIVRFAHMGYTDKTVPQYRQEILQLLGEGTE